MNNTYKIYLISDSTGETLERIFFAIKAQFKNIEYKVLSYSFTRTENQIDRIISEVITDPNSIILISLCSIISTIIVSIYPASKAASLDTVKTLKYE